ncbi:MAG: DUF1727 domain-containing protein [Oscillospiraceae bacterium]|nr:DUF1727 domain-containing protein [Oscillospiraceae bacterium]
MRFILTLWISKLMAIAVNLIDKKRGSNYAGKIAVKLMPGFVARFKGIDYHKVFFISGTNGKSTTTNLLYHTLRSAGKTVACNNEGANMMTGVATTLIKNSTLFGKLNKEYLVLEIDERSFPGIRKVLPGLHLGLTNLQKDQVQRNGDPDFILRKFRGAITDDMTLYLNNEEPRSRSLEDLVKTVQYFSVAPNARTYASDDFYKVTLPCPKCSHPIAYDHYNLANIGTFRCTVCDYASRPEPQVYIDSVDFENNYFTTGGSQWNVPYNNPFYIYNFAMCIAICRNIGLTDTQIQEGFASFKNPATHVNTFHSFGKEIHYLQGKQENPEALQSQLDIIASDNREKAVFVGMYEITDFDPYYSGSFYFFDCDFAPIVNSNASHFVAFSKTIAWDLAQRMILAGADPENVTIRDTNDPAEIFDMLPGLKAEVVYILTNTKHVPEIKAYLNQGGTRNE